MANLVILDPAQRELEEIAQLHMNLVGPNAARNITNLILDTLSRLEMFPLSGHIPQDKELRNGGYRYVIAGKYICVYRLIAETVYVYHIAHSASNYPTLFKRLLKEENTQSTVSGTTIPEPVNRCQNTVRYPARPHEPIC